MLIAGLNKTTLLDYPGRIAATVFTGGCNFRCPFCHNAGLVLSPSSAETYSEEDVFSFLQKRKNVLQGVCITGGEPTLQADLPEFIGRIKALGYAVKLDTNGYKPKVLKDLLEANLLDYVAMDVKNCLEKYELTTGVKVDTEQIKESVAILKSAGIDYEFRTTIVKEFHQREDMIKLGEWIKGCPKYYLQQFVESENIIGMQGAHRVFHAYDKAEMEVLAADVQSVLGATWRVQLRGVD
ncbi:MAG: anaerobic ribonucleoside-triphosphate reductase activating protein [Lachnospiraceae bacterium]|nr:anaerobic ribonucleoside-triphosphate reductase activating protein [Lachnospiraceae bacterium]